MPSMTDIPAHFDDIKKRIGKAERLAGRDTGTVQLVAVTKTQTDAALNAALETGHRLFGENKVQEAQAHWADRKAAQPDIKVHLIGPLQTNKAGDAVALFDCIETLDRTKLADALSAAMRKQGRDVPCLIQVNTGMEDQKGGVAPRDLPALLHHCRDLGLRIEGLMCIPPVDAPAGLHFAFLKNLAARHGLKMLSMGMSGDFEKAIHAGATHVRVGSGLFGARG